MLASRQAKSRTGSEQESTMDFKRCGSIWQQGRGRPGPAGFMLGFGSSPSSKNSLLLLHLQAADP